MQILIGAIGILMTVSGLAIFAYLIVDARRKRQRRRQRQQVRAPAKFVPGFDPFSGIDWSTSPARLRRPRPAAEDSQGTGAMPPGNTHIRKGAGK